MLLPVSISHVIVNPPSVLVAWAGKGACGDGNVLFSDSPPCRVLTLRKRELLVQLSVYPLAVQPECPQGSGLVLG